MNRWAFNQSDSILADATAYLKEQVSLKPDIALILGSGLGPLADDIEKAVAIPYNTIPGFVESHAPGHEGSLIFGQLAGKAVVAMKGRTHYYEGISAQQAGFPVRVMHALGASTLMVSNACGGLNPNWQAGDLMLQLDYLNFTGDNPLIGPNDDQLGPRFPIMFDCYDPEYQQLARTVARREDITLREGVYLAISGPTYATRAELRMFRSLGADTIGMSTVFEVMVARHAGMRVLGLSTVTDMAIADRDEHASGDDVVRVAQQSGATFRRLVKAIITEL
jgi:purine-nucleoside phosphorylase